MGSPQAVKLLLDTHIWLWSFLEPERLSRRVATKLEDPDNELWLSPISVWETLVLAEKGRLALRPSPSDWIEDALDHVPLQDAPLNRAVALTSRALSVATEDPADRFLAATAQVFDLTLVTADANLLETQGIAVLANARIGAVVSVSDAS